MRTSDGEGERFSFYLPPAVYAAHDDSDGGGGGGGARRRVRRRRASSETLARVCRKGTVRDQLQSTDISGCGSVGFGRVVGQWEFDRLVEEWVDGTWSDVVCFDWLFGGK